MLMHVSLFLLACAEPGRAQPAENWRLLLADHKGGYWIDARTGKVERDPKLVRKPVQARRDDPRSQKAPPPPNYVHRFRDTSISTANGVTVRMLKNRLRLETKEAKSWLSKVGAARHPALRPDGKVLAYFRWSEKRGSGKQRRADLVVRELATGKESVLVPNSHLHDVSWSPDGKLLAVSMPGSLTLFAPADNERKNAWTLQKIDARLFAHAPSGMVWDKTGTRIAMRFTFLGGRTAVAGGEPTEVFGDRQLFILNRASGKFRRLELPKGTCEGPIRGERRSAGK